MPALRQIGPERFVLDDAWQPSTDSTDGSYSVFAMLVGSIAVTKDRVYFGTSSGWVYSIDRATGKLSWKFELDNPVSAGVIFEGRYLCVGTADGYVHAFDELSTITEQ